MFLSAWFNQVKMEEDTLTDKAQCIQFSCSIGGKKCLFSMRGMADVQKQRL